MSVQLIVTPHVGVWIETAWVAAAHNRARVTPHVGVWIETQGDDGAAPATPVTPHVGVWIETLSMSRWAVNSCHPSRRGVD